MPTTEGWASLASWVAANAASLDDRAAAAAYNAASVAQPRRVLLADLARYAHDSGVYGVLLTRAANSAVPALQGVALEMLEIFRYQSVPDVDPANGRFTAGMQALQAAGDLSPEQAAAIAALGILAVPLYLQPGQLGQAATDQDVAAVRGS